MEITEYFRRRLAYQKRAKDRDIEKRNNGMNFDEDIPHYAKVTDEMIIDLMEKVESFEKLFGAPDPEKVEKPKIGSRLKLAEEKPQKKKIAEDQRSPTL